VDGASQHPGTAAAGPRDVGWLRRRLGVRLRSALAATAVVALVFAAASAVFVWQDRSTLTNNVDAAALAQARDIATEINAANAADIADIADRINRPTPGEQSVLQVLDRDGNVVVASTSIQGEPALSPLRPQPGQTLREDRQLPIAAQDQFRIVAVGVDTTTTNGPYTVLAGRSLRPVNDSVAAALALLVVGCPLLLATVGAATFVFVGRSLHPVEAIRRRVATISGRDLRARVPVPAARDEVARLAETMNAMLDRLEASANTQRRFVADASHELRSPLTTLRAGLELLAPHQPAPAGKTMDMLIEETDRMDRLISGLLLLARADDQGLALRASDVDLDDLVDAERQRLHPSHLVFVVTAQPVRVRGDAHQLAQALRNLVDNAVRYAERTVTVRLWQENGFAVLEVVDDGPGIPTADRERVFERFVRLDESRSRDAGGSGLGLAIVREIAHAHGGHVHVVDSPTGTVVRVNIRLNIESTAS
jgi:signal transduction histidine kinase